MAEQKPTWLLRVIEREVLADAGDPEAPTEWRIGSYRGELLYKGQVKWLLNADTEEELEALAREKMVIAKRIEGEEIEDQGYIIDLGE